MRMASPECRPLRGFTLLEILISVMIFSLVLAAINTVFYAALRLSNKTTAAIERSLPLRYAVPIIKRDLANIVVPGGKLSGDFQTAINSGGMSTLGGQSSPEFVTASGVIDQTSPWAEVQRVSYLLLDSTNQLGVKDLYRVVNRNLLSSVEEPPVPQWLMGGVRQINFLYYAENQWRDSWDSTIEETKLPSAIKMQIELETDSTPVFQPAPIELVVPVTVQALTNQTEQADEEDSGGGR